MELYGYMQNNKLHADCILATDYEDKEPQMKMQRSVL